jgi:hypothetical protein
MKLPTLKMFSAVGLVASLLTVVGADVSGFAQSTPTLSDQKIAAMIVKESRMTYYRTGHPCACPYDLARNGTHCGRRSAYSRPGGASPKCFVEDVSKEEIASYRLTRHLN